MGNNSLAHINLYRNFLDFTYFVEWQLNTKTGFFSDASFATHGNCEGVGV